MPGPDATLQWWETWGRSTQARSFTETDWSALQGAALVHADIWGNWNVDRVRELQSILAPFGGTPSDRARLAGEPLPVDGDGIPARWLFAVPQTGATPPMSPHRATGNRRRA
jgi:hypothetical protein